MICKWQISINKIHIKYSLDYFNTFCVLPRPLLESYIYGIRFLNYHCFLLSQIFVWLLNREGKMKSSVFSFSVKWHKMPLPHIIQQNTSFTNNLHLLVCLNTLMLCGGHFSHEVCMRVFFKANSNLSVRAFMHTPVTLPEELLHMAILEYPVKWKQHQFYIFKHNYPIKSIKVLFVHLATYCSCSLKDILSRIHFPKMRCASITESAKSSFRFSYDILRKSSNKFFWSMQSTGGNLYLKDSHHESLRAKQYAVWSQTDYQLWLCQAPMVWLGVGGTTSLGLRVVMYILSDCKN